MFTNSFMKLLNATYVVHAKTGYEIHENRINKLFSDHNLDFKFMTDGDPSVFTDELIYKYFDSDIKKKLSIGVLSCTLNHILCYEEIVKHNFELSLIFENDPFFLKNFDDNLDLVLNESKNMDNAFIVSLENSTLKFPNFKDIRKNKYLYKAKYGRFAGAYLINLAAAKNILEYLKSNKCSEVIDWWHNSLIDKGVIDMYWAHPPLTEQGSHNGLMSSTISTKKKNVKRRVAWLLQKYYKTYFLRFFTKN